MKETPSDAKFVIGHTQSSKVYVLYSSLRIKIQETPPITHSPVTAKVEITVKEILTRDAGSLGRFRNMNCSLSISPKLKRLE